MGKSLVIKVLGKRNNLSEFSLFVAFAFLIFLLSSLVPAQVIIKEKVEINPQTINPDYQISTLDPCPSISRPQYYQSVYSCSGFPIEPYQQLYPFQSGTFLIFNPTTLYEAEIISGTDYAYFERVEYIDSAGNFYPYETFGTLLSGLTGAELSGTGDFIGYEGAGTFERENSTVYRVRFDNYSLPEASVTIRIKNLNDNSYTDWHTLIVNPDLRFVNQQYEADTLLHYYSKDVTPKFMNANSPCSHPGYGGCPPDNVTFNIEIIEGQQFGSIKNSETSETATSFTGLSYNKLNTTFTYYANGEQPDSTSTVKIRHSSSDADIIPMEFSFTVKKNNIPPPSEGGSIFVKMDKKVVIPGDTVNVQLLWIDEVNDTVEFSQIQRFKVDLAEGSEYGTILDAETGDTSDTFTEITNEFKVIVNSQIEQQQAKIVLVVEADLMIFTRPVGVNNGTKTAKQLLKNSIDKVDEEGGTNTDFIIIGNHLVGVGEITITKTPFIVEIMPAVVSAGDTAKIIPMKLNPDGTTTPFDSLQTFELGMLDGCLLGKLRNQGIDTNYFYGVTQPFYFIADTSADSGSVNIRVGVIDMNPQNRSLANSNNNTPESDNPVSCANVSFVENLYVNANLVMGNGCDRYPCNEVILQPNLTYENFQDGTFSTNACIDVIPERGTGVFQTVPKETHKSYEIYFNIENITACYELNFDRWKFGHKLPLFPYFKVIIDTCPNNAIQFGYKPISSISEIKYRYHDSLKLCLAKIDLEGHRNYPPAITYGYVFMQVDYSHEQAHGEDYKNLIDSLQNAFLYPSLDSLQIGCAQVADNTQAKIIYKEELIRILVGQTYNGKIIFSGFENRLSIGKENHSKGSYLINGKILSYEEYINKFPIVENTINVLMADFKNIWNCK